MFQFYLAGLKKLLNIGKKIFLVIAVYFIVISLFIHFINKDKPKITIDPVKKNREEIYKVINDPKLKKTTEGRLTIALYRATLCGMIGEVCTNNPKDAEKNYNKSLFGFMTNLIILPYVNPPASGIYWAYSGLQNAGFIPKSYAAEGIGFAAIKPYANLWKVFRDFAYMLLVLVLIAIGFMIMFRMKLNPQTVISVEAALPKIVISLLLITFSFPIAGFLIDLMYIVIALAISLMSNNNTYYDTAKFQNEYLNADFWKLGAAMQPIKNTSVGLDFLMTFGNSLLAILGPLLNGAIRTIAGIAGTIYGATKFPVHYRSVVEALDAIHLPIIGGSLGKIPGLFLGLATSRIGAVLGAAVGAFILPQFVIGVLILFTILLLMFRIFFLLLRSYIQILLMIIFSPIFLLFEAVPGRSAFSFWFKNLAAEILTFPLVIIFFLVGYVIVNTLAAPTTSIWTPPFLYGLDPNAFSVILGMGIIFLIPDLVKLVKELMGVKPLPLSIGPGTFFAGGAAAAGGGLGLIGQYGSLALAFPKLREVMGRMPIIGDAFKDIQRSTTSTSTS